MTSGHRRSATLTAACLAASLGACTTPPTRVYSLEAIAPAAERSSAGAAGAPTGVPTGVPIRVDTVSVPPALDRSEIVSDESPGRLRIHDLDHWPAPLGEAARQALSADLDSRLAPGRLIFPHLPKPQDALGLSVDILSFHLDQGIARLQASWVITGPNLGPLRRTVTLRRDASATPSAATADAAFTAPPRTANDAARTAAALSNLLGDLADRIATSLAPADLRNSGAATGSEQ